MNEENNFRLYISVAVLSGALIAFQLVLMHILSIVQWNHFAFMVISVALLGFGASGTILSLAREWFIRHFSVVLPCVMFVSGIMMSCVVSITQTPVIGFDSYLVFVDPSHLWRLLCTYLLFFIPFFFGALAVGLVFIRYVDRIGALYFSNLLGSGIGGLIAIFLAWIFLPQQLPSVIALFPIAAGLIVVPYQRRVRLIAVGLASAIFVFIQFIFPSSLHLSQYKSLSRALNLPDAVITHERNSPYGFVQVLSSSALRYAPGVSLTYQGNIPVQQAVYNNGNWFGPVISKQVDSVNAFLDYTTNALPYSFAKRNSVLILNAGTGLNIAHAISHNVNRIVAVEPHAAVIELVMNEFSSSNDSLFHSSTLEVHQLDSRTYLATDTSHYDVITLPTVDAFGGTSGLYALQEQYLLTVETFDQIYKKLNPNGVFTVTTWMDYPVRNPLKILSTIMEMFNHNDIHDPTRYTAVVRSWGTITFIVKSTPLTESEIESVRLFADRLNFDPVLLPDITSAERMKYNQMEDSSFFQYVDRIISPERDSFYREYEFNIHPATDNQPYFSQFLRWKTVPHLAEIFGKQTLPFFEVGYALVVLTGVQIVLAAFVFIILPLFRLKWRGKFNAWNFFYFSAIGLGYMFVEIVFIQRFTLFFGQPIYSAGAIISAMLICSGIGSYYSSRLFSSYRLMRSIAFAIAVIILLYVFLLPPILQATISLSIEKKILFSILLISPLAFCMGLPFPIGLRFISTRSNEQVPWAWGINGCMSVLSTVLATIISVEAGFNAVMFCAAVFYSVAFVVNAQRA